MEKTKIVRNVYNIMILCCLVVGTAYVVLQFCHFGRVEFTDNARVRQHITPQCTRVQGFIREIRFDEFQYVHKGDTLAIIEDAEFNIFHMYLAGAAGTGLYTTLYSHLMNDNIVRYGSQLTLTALDMGSFNMGDFMDGYFVRSMMSVTIKQIYGIVIWIAGSLSAMFFLLDLPAVRTNVRRIPLWPVYGIELLSRLRPLRVKEWHTEKEA